jgi:hypothetical protein
MGQGGLKVSRTRQSAWVLAALALALVACGNSASTTTAAPEGTSLELYEDFESASFGRSTEIDHRWLPMLPGTRLIYEGATVVDGEDIPHRVVTTVTDLTKMIGEVRTLVLWEEDYEVDQLVEAELAFFAQDDAGNVWLMGEYPEEYVKGELVATPAWISGLQDARPGILIPADPQPGTPSYSQGWGPAVEWYDRGQVSEGGLSDCVPAGCYEEIVAIDEFGLTEPNFFQVKYYAPGVGVVRVGWKGPDPDQETLELVEVIQLSAEELAAVRASALELETRAYELSQNVYGTTSPAEPAS